MLDRNQWVCLKLSWLSPGWGPCRYVSRACFRYAFHHSLQVERQKLRGLFADLSFRALLLLKSDIPLTQRLATPSKKYSHLWYFLGILKQVGIALPPGYDAPLGSIACSSEGCRPPLTDMCVRSLVYRGLFASPQLLDVKGHRFGIYQKVHKLTNKQIYVYVYIYTHTWTWNFEHIIAWLSLVYNVVGRKVSVFVYAYIHIKTNNVYM